MSASAVMPSSTKTTAHGYMNIISISKVAVWCLRPPGRRTPQSLVKPTLSRQAASGRGTGAPTMDR